MTNPNAKKISVGSHVSLSAEYVAEQEDLTLQCVHQVVDYNRLYGFRVTPIQFTENGARSLDHIRSRWVDVDNLAPVG